MNEKQLFKAVTQFRKGFLRKRRPDLMCVALSTALQGFLSVCDVRTELIAGEIDGILCSHYWLELSDGRIIDATGSQFNDDHKLHKTDDRSMPEVYIGEKPEWYLISEIANQ